jgi:hypothetical protein
MAIYRQFEVLDEESGHAAETKSCVGGGRYPDNSWL